MERGSQLLRRRLVAGKGLFSPCARWAGLWAGGQEAKTQLGEQLLETWGMGRCEQRALPASDGEAVVKEGT